MAEGSNQQILGYNTQSKKLLGKLRLAELNRLLKEVAGIEIVKISQGELITACDVTKHSSFSYNNEEYFRGENRKVKFVARKDESRTIVFQDLC